MRTRASAKRALRLPSMKAAATKPKAVAASTTNASWRRAPVRVIAYHPAASATTISGTNTASRRRSASVLAIVATTTTAARRMAPRAATRCDIRGRVAHGSDVDGEVRRFLSPAIVNGAHETTIDARGQWSLHWLTHVVPSGWVFAFGVRRDHARHGVGPRTLTLVDEALRDVLT